MWRMAEGLSHATTFPPNITGSTTAGNSMLRKYSTSVREVLNARQNSRLQAMESSVDQNMQKQMLSSESLMPPRRPW
jgi:hypothetical protein